MKKLFIMLALSVLVSSVSFGQSFKDKFLMSYGWGLHYSISPATVYTFDQVDDWTGETHTYYAGDQWGSFSLYDYVFDFRYNLVEPNKNLAVSLKASPTLGVLEFSNMGMLSFQLPILIELDKGAGSTYDASDDKGFFFNAGISIMMNPLIATDEGESEVKSNGGTLKKTWVTPTMGVGYRYWNSRNRMKEVALQVGFPPKGDAIPENIQNIGSFTSVMSPLYIGITFKRFLNY